MTNRDYLPLVISAGIITVAITVASYFTPDSVTVNVVPSGEDIPTTVVNNGK